MSYRCLLVLILAGYSLSSHAQSTYEYGLLPSLNFNKKLKNDWALNLKIESRQSILDEGIEYLLTDISFAAAKKIGATTTLALGYLTRKEGDDFKNRIFQQLILVNRYAGFNLAHRLSTDQTFSSNEPTSYRIRYRLSTELPLNGQSIDINEFFVKLNNEYLNAFESDTYDLEIRGAGFLGYVFSGTSKLEFGLEYRLNSFLNTSPRHRFWIGINYYKSI